MSNEEIRLSIFLFVEWEAELAAGGGLKYAEVAPAIRPGVEACLE